MEIAITTASILVITGLTLMANRILPSKVCPICAAVSGTWFWLTAAGLYGFIPAGVYQPFILLLMGGTVVGVAFQGERSLAWAGRWPLVWKTAVILIGFPAAFWAATNASPTMLAIEAVALAGLIYIFFIRRASDSAGDDGLPAPTQVQELEKRLKDCC